MGAWEIAESDGPAAVLHGAAGAVLLSIALGSQGFLDAAATVETWRDARVSGPYAAIVTSTLDHKKPPRERLVARTIEIRDGTGHALFSAPAPLLTGGIDVAFCGAAPVFAVKNLPDDAATGSQGYLVVFDGKGALLLVELG